MLILEIAAGIVLGVVLLKALQIFFDSEGIRIGIAKAMRQDDGRGPLKQGVRIAAKIFQYILILGIISLILLIGRLWPSQVKTTLTVIWVVGLFFWMTWFIVHELCRAASERWPKLHLHWGHTALWLSGLQTAIVVAICGGNLASPMAVWLLVPLALMALGLARTLGSWNRHETPPSHG